MSTAVIVERLRRQQEALADFGSFAFREKNLQSVLTEAARICAACLDVPFAKICRYRAEENDLFVIAGCGWRGDVVDKVVSKADDTTTQGRAFITGEPVILEDIGRNNSYVLPNFYAEHAIVSTADVLIKSKSGGSWGVLEVDSTTVRSFDRHDIVFLTGFANVVAEAVVTSERTEAMCDTIDRMALLIAQKDRLLTEREAREIEVRDLQAQLLHISRVNALGQMTAALAHEINQPLASIANYIGAAKFALESEGPGPQVIARAQEMIAKAQEQTFRAVSVIKKLRDMVEKRDSVRRAEDLEEIVRSAISIGLFSATDYNITMTIAIAEALPQVLIDRVQIQQILFNLIRNSIEAMSDVKIRKLEIAVGRGEPGFLDVTVRDSGIGMTPDVATRLFRPFVTTKADGMGLGLMICRILAEANGGRIWRLDDETRGTALRFCLPIAIAPGQSLPIAA